jgi:hypothetical protein
MMEKQTAIALQAHALNAVTELTRILAVSQKSCIREEHEQIKRAVASCIGEIQVRVPAIINSAYPELDDLK